MKMFKVAQLYFSSPLANACDQLGSEDSKLYNLDPPQGGKSTFKYCQVLCTKQYMLEYCSI